MVKSSFFSTKEISNIFAEPERGIDIRYRWYRFKWIFAPKFHYVTEFPTHLDIEISNKCNLRCVMCPINFMDEKGGLISFGLFKKIIDEGADYGLNSIKLNWRGEPLIHPKIVDMVKYAKERGVLDVQFNTNGLLLTPEKSRELIDAGLDRIIFSVDGASKEVYEKIRKGGNFDLLTKNIKHFVKIKREKKSIKPFTRIQMVEMKENKHEVKKFVEMWTPFIDEVCANPYLNPWGMGEDRSTKSIKVLGRKPCNQLWQRMTISYDGKVMMCCGDWSMKSVIGDVNEKSIYSLWHGKKLNKIRKMHINNRVGEVKACEKCPVLDSYNVKILI
jgi:radical SAM protein with 4Fe4S-binding SPASM domain